MSTCCLQAILLKKLAQEIKEMKLLIRGNRTIHFQDMSSQTQTRPSVNTGIIRSFYTLFMPPIPHMISLGVFSMKVNTVPPLFHVNTMFLENLFFIPETVSVKQITPHKQFPCPKG